MYIIMLGKPGSGKGTVGRMLSESLGIAHISSGEIFRNYIKKAGEIGVLVEEYVNKGVLVPDELTIKLVEKRLNEKDCEKGVILDGYPRNISQAEELDKFLKAKDKKIDIAVELNLSDEDIIKRIITRRECSNTSCREVYNLDFKRPMVDGICDKCGSKLIQRDDDKEETIKERLRTYHESTEKIIDYYKSKDILYTVKLNMDSGTTSEDVAKEIEEKFKK